MTLKTFANSRWRVFWLVIFFAFFVYFQHEEKEEYLENQNHVLKKHEEVFNDSIKTAFAMVDIAELATYRGEVYSKWESWGEIEGVSHLKTFIRDGFPVRNFLIFDSRGIQKHTSFSAPANPISITDRQYYLDIIGGDSKVFFGPYISKNTGIQSYSSVVKILDYGGTFSGLLVTSMELSYFDVLCQSSLPGPKYSAGLFTSKGKVLTYCSKNETDLDLANVDWDWKKVLIARGISAAALEGLELKNQSVDLGNHLLVMHAVAGPQHTFTAMILDKEEATREWIRHHYSELGMMSLLALFGFFPWLRMRL